MEKAASEISEWVSVQSASSSIQVFTSIDYGDSATIATMLVYISRPDMVGKDFRPITMEPEEVFYYPDPYNLFPSDKGHYGDKKSVRDGYHKGETQSLEIQEDEQKRPDEYNL